MHATEISVKTERVTLLTTVEFKAFLASEAAREGVSVAELVRSRCERRPDPDEAALAALALELRAAVRDAQRALRAGLAEADALVAELKASRDATAVRKTRVRRGRDAAHGVAA